MTSLACKQKQLYWSESSIDESDEVGNVYSGGLCALIVKTYFALFRLYMSESEADSLTFNEARSFPCDIGYGLYQLYGFS